MNPATLPSISATSEASGGLFSACLIILFTQYSRLLELTGSGVQLNGKTGVEALESLFASAEYKSWDDAKKSKQARKLITDYRKAAKNQLLQEDKRLRAFFGIKAAPQVKPKSESKAKSKPK